MALGAAAPGRTAYAVKRLIGRYYNDNIVQKARNMYPYHILESSSGGGVTIQLGEKQYTPEEISTLLLKDLVSRNSRILGSLMLPQYFSDKIRARRSGPKLLLP